MKRFLIIYLMLACLVPGHCEEKEPLNVEVKEICNKVIISVYSDLLKAKERYPELKALDEKVLYTNPEGIYAIFYQSSDQMTKNDYRFSLTFAHLEDEIFKDHPGYFAQEFPFLNLKLAGFVQKNPYKTSFDIFTIINQYVSLLADYQQKYLPLRISLVSLKESFKVGERVEFEVVLEN